MVTKVYVNIILIIRTSLEDTLIITTDTKVEPLLLSIDVTCVAITIDKSLVGLQIHVFDYHLL